MPLSHETAVPALWPPWLIPRRIALAGVGLLFVDMIFGDLFTPAGLPFAQAALPQFLTTQFLRSFAFMVAPALVLALVCLRAAPRARGDARRR